jgi:O-antigen ligase
VALGAIAAISAMVMFYGVEGRSFPQARLRAYGRGGNPLDVAPIYSIIVVWVTVWLAETRPLASRVKWLAIACLVPILACLVLSQDRAAIVGITVSLLLLLILDRTRYLRHAAIIAGMLAVTFVGLLIGPFDWIGERGFSFRPAIWRIALDYATQNPWFGYGLLTRLRLDVGQHLVFWHPHNIVLSVWLQGGLVALGLFALLLAVYFRIAWRQFRHDGSILLMGLMLCGLTNAVVDFFDILASIDRVWFAIWLPIGLAVGYQVRSADAGLVMQPRPEAGCR